MPSLEDGTSIHQATQIFYSCNLHGRLDQRPLDVAEGTVAIKRQGKLGSQTVTALRVMIKKAKGFDPAHGDFAFESRDPEAITSARAARASASSRLPSGLRRG